MLSHMDLVSDLQDQDVVSVAKQWCGISRKPCTHQAFQSLKEDTLFSHFNALYYNLDCW